jgi:hypothetical protein
MPVLYFASEGLERPVQRRATLTFGELRGMFGGYESRYVSRLWPQCELAAGARFASRVVFEVSEREGANAWHGQPGFYILVGLAPAKVDELLKYRESYARRLDDAERWEIAHTRVPHRRRRPR